MLFIVHCKYHDYTCIYNSYWIDQWFSLFFSVVSLVWDNHTNAPFSPNSTGTWWVIKWKRFPRYWPFVRGIHRSPVNSPHTKASDAEFDVSFDLHLNKRLNKQSWGWWFETSSAHCDVIVLMKWHEIQRNHLPREWFTGCSVHTHKGLDAVTPMAPFTNID